MSTGRGSAGQHQEALGRRRGRVVLAVCAALALLLALAAQARAGVNSWSSIGPDGGRVIGLAINPQTPATVYASTAGRVFKSTSSGASWGPAGSGLEGRQIRSLVINPSTTSVLYVATDDGLYKTSNAGGSWGRLSQEFWPPSLETVAVAPSSPATLYVGTAFGVYRSADAGASWLEVVDVSSASGASVLAVHPANPALVYAVDSTSGRLFTTTNSGAGWHSSDAGLPSGERVAALVINPAAPDTLYVTLSATGGVYKSTDGGASWNPANTGVADKTPYALAIDPQQPATLYLQASDDLYRSADAGASWQIAETGMELVSVQVVAVDPSASDRVYVGTYGRGVYRSTDSGASWAASNDGLHASDIGALVFGPQSPPLLYAASYDRELFTSADDGALWGVVASSSSPPFAHLVVDPQSPTTLYAGGYRGPYKSVDGGVTWILTQSGCSVFCFLINVSDLEMNPQSSDTLYMSSAGTNNFGVYRSTMSGVDWQQKIAGMSNAYVLELEIDPLNPTTIYAGTEGGVYKSTDSAESWASANNGIPATADISRLELAPSSPTTLYASNGFALYRSTDGAASWVELGRPADAAAAGPILIDPASATTLYVHFASGIHRSTDGGASWARVGAELSDTIVNALVLHPTEPDLLYAAVSGGGVYTYEAVAAPTVTGQPTGVTIAAGQSAALSVTATDSTALSYQWYLGPSGDTSAPVSGAGAASYATPALSSNASYWARVTNSHGAYADSAAAQVTVVTDLEINAPTTAQPDVAIQVAVQARDSAGAVAGGYRGTVRITSSDGQATLPGDYTFSAGDAGTHTFTVTLRSQGSQTISAVDTAAAPVGGEAPIQVAGNDTQHWLYLPLTIR